VRSKTPKKTSFACLAIHLANKCLREAAVFDLGRSRRLSLDHTLWLCTLSLPLPHECHLSLLVQSRLLQFLLKGLATKTCSGDRLVVLLKFILGSRQWGDGSVLDTNLTASNPAGCEVLLKSLICILDGSSTIVGRIIEPCKWSFRWKRAYLISMGRQFCMMMGRFC
jgi:hypothetical protein